VHRAAPQQGLAAEHAAPSEAHVGAVGRHAFDWHARPEQHPPAAEVQNDPAGMQ
jgi:hypothetical protein